MNEIKTVILHCLSTAIAPITHMMGTSGNEAIINRTRVVSAGQVYDVPVLSGNAIRHKMIREPGAMFVIEACELYGKLSIDQANFLFYGGSLVDSAIADNLVKIAAMQELLPLYRLLGGSLTNQVLGGSLLVSMGVLVCEENREVLEKMLPKELIADLPELRSCEEFVSGWQYTRGDAVKNPGVLKPDETAPDKSNLMIYSGQHVIPGAIFYHKFTLQNISSLELGALIASLNDWQAAGGIIGGSSRIGHGQLSMGIYTSSNDFWGSALDLSSLEDGYRAFTRRSAERIRDWLNDTFPAKLPVRAGKKTAKYATAYEGAGDA